MDIKQILKEKIENARKERGELTVGRTYRQIRLNHLVSRLNGEIDAYNDCLTTIEQSEKPMKPIPHSYYHKCPKCGEYLASTYPHCPYCGQPLDWGEGEKK